MEVVAYILGLLVLIEFFHVGYLVNQIRNDTTAALIEVRAIKEALAAPTPTSIRGGTGK